MTTLTDLELIVREVEAHVGNAGWDQSPRLFALVSTKELLASDPSLKAELTGELALTSIEQELEETSNNIEDLLGSIAWPDEVLGAIIAVERIILPTSAEADLPMNSDAELMDAAIHHPGREDVRLVSAVLRDGQNLNALRQRLHDSTDSVAVAPDLVPNLNEALRATFN